MPSKTIYSWLSLLLFDKVIWSKICLLYVLLCKGFSQVLKRERIDYVLDYRVMNVFIIKFSVGEF